MTSELIEMPVAETSAACAQHIRQLSDNAMRSAAHAGGSACFIGPVARTEPRMRICRGASAAGETVNGENHAYCTS